MTPINQGKTSGLFVVSTLLIRLLLASVFLLLLLPNAQALGLYDRVKATGPLNVRDAPASTNPPLEQKSAGDKGFIIDGPTNATYQGTSYVWWKVIWDDNVTGWSIANTMQTIPSWYLDVYSSNPNSGVAIAVSPADAWYQLGSGSTYFWRLYDNNVNVTLTAPATAGGNNFIEWDQNGSFYSSSQTTTVTMNADYSMTAVYGCTLPGFPGSPNPANGATISSQPTILDWSDASFATSYDVYLDGTFRANVTTSQWTLNQSLTLATHTWYVVPKNSCGQSLGPPVVWSFTISPPVGSINLTVNSSSGSTLPTTEMNAVLLYNSSYTVVASSSPPGSNPLTFSSIGYGNYYLEVYCWDMLAAQSGTFSLNSSTTFITATTNPKRPLNVTVYYNDGATPLVGATVYLDSFNGQYSYFTTRASATTDSSGNASFSAYPTTQTGEYYQIRVNNGGSQFGLVDPATVANTSSGSSYPITTTVAAPPIPTDFGGIVTDSFTTSPISGATVTWGNNYSTTTDANGVYSLNNITCGTATLTISKAGYQTYSQSYTPNCNASSVMSVSLTPGLSGNVIRSGGYDSTIYPVSIQTYPIPRIINPNKQTWLVIHGRGSSRSAENIAILCQAIAANRPGDQVLTLDWRAAEVASGIAGDADYLGADAIVNVAIWADSALQNYGFSATNLNLVGHSWGACVAAEMAQRTTKQINTIVALDPAEDAPTIPPYYDTEASSVDFSKAKYSWAFHSSLDGSAITPTTASEAVIVDTGLELINPPDAHNAVADLFAYMIGSSDSISSKFHLDRLLNYQAGPWIINQFASHFSEFYDGIYIFEDLIPGYECGITTTVGGLTPDSLVYYSNSTGQKVTEFATGVPPTVAEPSISHNGGSYLNSVQVTLACSTPGATIRYTTDGSDPTSTSSIYAAPFSLTTSASIKAKAFLAGYNDSTIAFASFTITGLPSVATPTISPNGGSYSDSVQVTLACSTLGAFVYYTTDGSDPTTSSTSYQGPFMLGNSATVKTKAFMAGYNDSAIASADFTITPTPTRVISLSGNLAFGNVLAGTSTQSTLTINNTGNSTMTVSSISYPSGFSGDWSGSVAANNSQPVTVTFSPTSVTSYGGTVTVNSDMTSGVNTITASGTGTTTPPPTGALQVNLLPAGAVSAGALWQVDGNAWQSDGATVSGLSVGNHTVAFNTVNGWTTPANQTVTISANQTTTAAGTYVVVPQTGSILVNILPQGAVDAGAQWRFTGESSWRNTKTIALGLSLGTYEVEYSTVSGWATPDNQQVVIDDTTLNIWLDSYLYVQLNNLPQLTGIAVSTNGMFLFNLNGSAGSNYVIQVSSNLVNWVNWVTNVISAGGLRVFDFPIQTNQPEMFYRALPLSQGPLILQPGPVDSQDIWTTSVYSYASCSGSYPGGGLNDYRLRVGGWGDLYYTLIQFNLTGLPTNAASAVLYLYCGNITGGGTPMYLDRITSFWDWRTQGTGCDRLRLWWADRPSAIQWAGSQLPTPTLGQWYAVDITTLYNDWQNGTYPNYGVQFRPVSYWNNNFDEFYSADYLGDPTLRPKLVVTPPSVPIVIASNLAGPGVMVLDGNSVYFGDSSSTDGMIKSVPKSGGTVSTLLTGLSTYESRFPFFVVTNGTIYGGYGGYNGYNIFSAPTNGGTATPIVSTTGGYFFGVANSLVYYGSGFNYINSVTTSGANPTQLASGIWVRGVALDADAIFFCDYFSKDVRKYSFSSGTVTPLVTGNPTEVGVFIDANNVYFNVSGNVEEVPKSGGTVTTLVSSGTANGYVSDGINVFYVDNNTIKSIPVSGGTPSTLVGIPANSLSWMVQDDSYIYWNDGSGGAGAGKIWRMAKP